jgi:glycosyltransferase involved in cell wall biosynthesis
MMTTPERVPQELPPGVRIAWSCQALGQGGGFERYTRDVLRELVRRGMVPVVYARTIDRTLLETFRVEARRVFVGWSPSSWRDLVFALQLRLRRRDVAASEYLIACNRPSDADLAICGGTHVGHMRARGMRPRIKDRIELKLERLTYQRARYIVAHSEAMASELKELYGIAPRKICVLYPPVDSARFRTVTPDRRRELRSAMGFPSDGPVFGFVSTSHARKGLAEVLACFDRAGSEGSEIHLAVAGRKLPNTARNVLQLGYLDDIEEFLQACDCMIIASTYEPFGLVGVESILCGTPVILAEGVGCGEIVAGPAKITYSRAEHGLPAAIEEARQRWRNNGLRIENPRESLLYDPNVAAHVDGLIQIIGRPRAEE